MDDAYLRHRLVDSLREGGWITTAPVEEAMRATQRHLFLPDASLEEAYEDKNVPTKTGPDGECLSSASAPHVVAMMLEQAEIAPGHRVLEVGAGTGYNAALLTRLGATVTTIDIDADAVAHTRKALERAGVAEVTLVEGDGGNGVADGAPYDRIIVTAGAWDLPPAWTDQLAPDGLLVVPLRFRGTTRSVCFQRDGDERLTSRSVRLCGFIPMRGPGGDGERVIDLEGGVRMVCDEDQDITGDALAGALDCTRHQMWSGVEIGEEPVHGVWGRLTAVEAGTCRVTAEPMATRFGRANPAIPSLSPALVEGGSLAYLANKPRGGGRSELGSYGHGPHGRELCERLIAQIRAWGPDRHERLRITAAPRTAGAAAEQTKAQAVTKHHTTLFIAHP
ncbi:methyltransferase, FxLD system [Streptomonospora nanhaiensis]|uniref:methyltransferase, FxLD system n=1 Tax=Streptomonospora nanhaiensis TaxID=1323731 RepID=UPI001C38ACDE|nr:methyltransferase, FxLD system [Streptomonospora nanhaiensis]MBV2366856.1 methyltransferase, FxLD system [Streptomonospora nanhaiensis]MBX9387646.1 methyltransferase, FxLD system [Streptomonospora nanhaiensis]